MNAYIVLLNLFSEALFFIQWTRAMGNEQWAMLAYCLNMISKIFKMSKIFLFAKSLRDLCV
jgi:hypothetical protein